jgi:hypothetical protein
LLTLSTVSILRDRSVQTKPSYGPRHTADSCSQNDLLRRRPAIEVHAVGVAIGGTRPGAARFVCRDGIDVAASEPADDLLGSTRRSTCSSLAATDLQKLSWRRAFA